MRNLRENSNSALREMDSNEDVPGLAADRVASDQESALSFAIPRARGEGLPIGETEQETTGFCAYERPRRRCSTMDLSFELLFG